jgi:hypothetical protein
MSSNPWDPLLESCQRQANLFNVPFMTMLRYMHPEYGKICTSCALGVPHDVVYRYLGQYGCECQPLPRDMELGA